MTDLSRRRLLSTGLATLAPIGAFGLSGCVQTQTAPYTHRIDARVDQTLGQMFQEFPKTRQLAARSAGMLVMPVVTEAGLFLGGGGYGRGALRIGGATVDYYSATKATVGPQFGANQYAHVLFFLSPDGLSRFRDRAGLSVGAQVDAAVWSDGETYTADSIALTSPVVGIIFGQAGLRLGATLEGTKYTVLRDTDLEATPNTISAAQRSAPTSTASQSDFERAIDTTPLQPAPTQNRTYLDLQDL